MWGGSRGCPGAAEFSGAPGASSAALIVPAKSRIRCSLREVFFVGIGPSVGGGRLTWRDYCTAASRLRGIMVAMGSAARAGRGSGGRGRGRGRGREGGARSPRALAGPAGDRAPAAEPEGGRGAAEGEEARGAGLGAEVSQLAEKAAGTFAPKASGPTGKNPAQPGTPLYNLFTVQGYASVVLGGLLAFNVLAPSEGPSMMRAFGMWSIWMLTVPSLRARDCSKAEKEVLNLLFVGLPLINVLIPLVAPNFGLVFSADVAAMAGLYYLKLGPGNERREA